MPLALLIIKGNYNRVILFIKDKNPRYIGALDLYLFLINHMLSSPL